MERQIILGPYELIDDDVWISREKVAEGTCRVIEGLLYFSEEWKRPFSEPKYSVVHQCKKDYEWVVCWVRYDVSSQ